MFKLPPLLVVKNYDEMLTKLTWYQVIWAAVSIYLLRTNIAIIDSFLLNVETSIHSFAGDIKLLSWVPAFIIAMILGHAFKLHDKLSNLFGIRRRFDQEHILLALMKGVGIDETEQLVNHLKINRHEAMSKIFYKYASSTDVKPLVGGHSIYQALTQWSWYWVFLEGAFYAFSSSAILFLSGVRDISLYCLLAAFVFIALQLLIRPEIVKYSKAQTSGILHDENACREIRAYFDEI